MGRTVEPKVLALARSSFLWCVSYLESIRGVLDGVRRGHVGPPGPLEFAALVRAQRQQQLQRAEAAVRRRRGQREVLFVTWRPQGPSHRV